MKSKKTLLYVLLTVPCSGFIIVNLFHRQVTFWKLTKGSTPTLFDDASMDDNESKKAHVFLVEPLTIH